MSSLNPRNARPASSTPARTSTPQPGKSSNDPTKRSHNEAFSQSLSVGTGNELLSQMDWARATLKKTQPEAKAFDEIIKQLSIPNDALKTIPRIKEALKGDAHIEWIPATGTAPDMFKYKPLHPVTNAEQLKDYLAKRDSAQGILAKELKDGWPDCVAAIDQLEKEGFVLVTRNKKDNTPRFVYPDSPSIHITVDQDFKDRWMKIKVPTAEVEIRNELEKAGVTPTSQVKDVAKGNMRKKERKRPNRRGGKTTNQHMAGILKDYSKR